MSHISSVAQQLGEFSSLQPPPPPPIPPPPPPPIPPPLRLISPFPQIILDPALPSAWGHSYASTNGLSSVQYVEGMELDMYTPCRAMVTHSQKYASIAFGYVHVLLTSCTFLQRFSEILQISKAKTSTAHVQYLKDQSIDIIVPGSVSYPRQYYNNYRQGGLHRGGTGGSRPLN